MNNAKPRRGKIVDEYIESQSLRKAPQPGYSPDVAPSDFFLFGYVKIKLEGQYFSSEEELYEAVTEIIMKIDLSVLRSVYSEWIKRLVAVIKNKGLYP